MDEWRKRAGVNGYAVASQKLLQSARQSHHEALTKFLQLNKKCKGCQTPITYEGRRNDFCTKSCSTTYYNSKRRSAKRCVCGKLIARRTKRCRECSIITDINLANTDKTRKEVLIRTHGHSCMKCQTSIWNGAHVALELDHIDGDSDNNQESNLRILCPNCHAQTDTYKGRNKRKGSTRKLYRAMRYERAMRV